MDNYKGELRKNFKELKDSIISNNEEYKKSLSIFFGIDNVKHYFDDLDKSTLETIELLKSSEVAFMKDIPECNHSFIGIGIGSGCVCQSCGVMMVKEGAFTQEQIKQIQIEATKPSVGKLKIWSGN